MKLERCHFKKIRKDENRFEFIFWVENIVPSKVIGFKYDFPSTLYKLHSFLDAMIPGEQFVVEIRVK